ncbi:glycerophosphocholine phosphodiesterase GPCPD1-like isoform X2 [Sphaeramia orbicularis]|uniref:Glycerophosphocholine phosphodiesterase GPCPD1-like n=1 Tax=Sphaeramia orbicularis TaxID=375764 RepID=A0A673BKN4_9TELE|nr:glycerophosphocholine phosphodiesterase GPCPD1-like isoform X2 [Sphaeramia orbicularis]
METTQVTLVVRGETSSEEVIAVVGSCDALGNWSYQDAVTLNPVSQFGDRNTWTTTVTVPTGVEFKYRYFKGIFQKSESENGPRQVVVTMWETHLYPRKLNPTESEMHTNDGLFGIHDGVTSVDPGWLTCQAEVRLRLHYSKTPPVSISKRRFSNSKVKIKLQVVCIDKDKNEPSLSSLLKLPTTVEIRKVSEDGYTSTHSQPENGEALEPPQWIEYIIRTMDPDNLQVTFEFFEEDVNGYGSSRFVRTGLVGTACLVSPGFLENGTDYGRLTLPIMGHTSRHAIGTVTVDYLVIQPIQDLQCDMSSSFTKFWKKRSPLDIGHRGTGRTHSAKHYRIRENTINAFKTAAKHGAAYVQFEVQLSKDQVPVIYGDLTCITCAKTKNRAFEYIEIPVKDLKFDQLQSLKLGMMGQDPTDMQADDDKDAESQPFPQLSQIFHKVSEYVGFNIEIKWIAQTTNESWDSNVSSYFNMNTFLDIILSCVLENAATRRIIFSCCDADICSMVRRKQNKYPVLFQTQGLSDRHPELMDIHCRSTPFAVNFALSEDILGICANAADLLKNVDYVREIQSKGLVVFSWGEENNDSEARKEQSEQKIDGYIYDRICEAQIQQRNIFHKEKEPQCESTEEAGKSYCNIS